MTLFFLASRCGTMHKTGFWGEVTSEVILEKGDFFHGVLRGDGKKDLKCAM